MISIMTHLLHKISKKYSFHITLYHNGNDIDLGENDFKLMHRKSNQETCICMNMITWSLKTQPKKGTQQLKKLLNYILNVSINSGKHT